MQIVGDGGDSRSRLRFLRRALFVAQLAQHRSQCGMRPGKVRLQPNGLAQRGRGFRQFPPLLQDRAQRVMRFRVVGLMLNRRLQLFGRLVKFASLPEQNSERIVRIRQVWLQPDRVLELGNRLVELILQLVSQAQVVVQRSIFRAQA